MLPQALRSLRSTGFCLAFAIGVLGALNLAGSMKAQTAFSSTTGYRAPADRLTQPVVESNRVVLQGTMHPLATRANDRGAASDGMKLDRIQVVLKRSDAQESALKQLIGEMHSQGSASYHKWLTPEDFGKRFGPSDADVAKLESWLGSHGFSITKLNPGRQTLEIAGTAGQFRDTFHTQIHSYQVKGVAGGVEMHYANAGAPEIPAALAPVFGGFASLNNFHLKSHAHVLGTAQYNPATHEAKPNWTFGSGSNYSLLVAPADFAVQYDLNPLYTAGTNGTGQSIAIVNEANINIALVNNYRALFGLPVNPPQVIIDGSDPGIDGNNSPYGRNGASIEAYLDVEVAGAVAPDAQVNLVIADSTAIEDGLVLAAERAVYSNIAPVISLSFGNCEAFLGTGNAFWSNLWEQAAAQGITAMVSSGDSGSASCDDDNSQQFAVYGQAVNGIASTPYNVAVGGTDFYYSGGSASFVNYWNNLSSPTTNTPSVSLKTKIPEQPFNSSQFGLDIYPQSDSNETSIFAAGGGASTLGLAGAGANGAYGPYPKPSWQTGAGVPADGARDLPDVSLFGSLSTNGSYTPICASDGDCATPATFVQFSGVGGTSVAAPEFAGMMALVNQKYGRQGQANYVLYPLAAQFPSAFNDVTAGTNTVPCNLNTVEDSNGDVFTPIDCQTASPAYSIDDNGFGTSLEGEIGVTANAASYNAGTGYDLASGLGSVDANNLVTNWGSVRTGTSTTTLTASPTSFAHGTAVAISGTVSGTSPTGSVGLLTTSTDANTQGETLFPVVNGAYSGTVNFLPGGTYTISAYYSGDGSNGPSTSAPVQVTVTPEASTTALTLYTTVLANTAGTLASGGTISYGAVAALSAKATGTTSGAGSLPTGSVVFSDGTTALNTAVVNADGDAEFTKAFALGSHSITAKYSGDQSFTGSSTAATTFSVVANTPTIYVTYTNADSNGDAVSGQTTYVAVQVENSSSYANAQALPPAGKLTITGAPSGVPATATLVPSIDPQGGAPEGTAYFAFPASQAGTSNLTLTFTPSDANYTTATASGSISFVGSAGSIATAISASANATTTSPTSAVVVTATVTAASGGVAPTGTVVLYASEEAVGFASLPTSSSSSTTVSIGLSSGSLFGGTNQITAQYFPNTNTYIGSAATFTVTNPLNDFSLVPATTIVNVPGPGVISAGVQNDIDQSELLQRLLGHGQPYVHGFGWGDVLARFAFGDTGQWRNRLDLTFCEYERGHGGGNVQRRGDGYGLDGAPDPYHWIAGGDAADRGFDGAGIYALGEPQCGGDLCARWCRNVDDHGDASEWVYRDGRAYLLSYWAGRSDRYSYLRGCLRRHHRHNCGGGDAHVQHLVDDYGRSLRGDGDRDFRHHDGSGDCRRDRGRGCSCSGHVQLEQ